MEPANELKSLLWIWISRSNFKDSWAAFEYRMKRRGKKLGMCSLFILGLGLLHRDHSTLRHTRIPFPHFWCACQHWLMGKKSHAPLFTLFVYFTHLVPPTGLFWTNFFALPFKPILLPCHLALFVALPFQPKNAPSDGDNCVKLTKVEAAVPHSFCIIHFDIYWWMAGYKSPNTVIKCA